MNIQEEITKLENQIMELSAYSDLDFDNCHMANGKIAIRVNTASELSKVRAKLKEDLGSWNDELEMKWVSGNCVISSYKSEVHPSLEIWASCSIDDPKEFVIGKCRVETRTTEESFIVCGLEE